MCEISPGFTRRSLVQQRRNLFERACLTIVAARWLHAVMFKDIGRAHCSEAAGKVGRGLLPRRGFDEEGATDFQGLKCDRKIMKPRSSFVKLLRNLHKIVVAITFVFCREDQAHNTGGQFLECVLQRLNVFDRIGENVLVPFSTRFR